MSFYLNYIIYIIYSFLFLFSIYVCLLIYKKYTFLIFNNELITSEKYCEKNKKKIKSNQALISNTSKRIKKLKSQYKIKSTEKTYEEIQFISQKPNYINVSNTDMYKFDFINIENIDKIKNYNEDAIVKKITQIYLKTKQAFYTQFVNSETNKYYINNISDFSTFHKNSLSNNSLNNSSNILIKFYNENNMLNHMYIFVDEKKMIKIINNVEYDNICNMIEKNNGPFMLEDIKCIIGYGSYSQSENNLHDIKKIFFNNTTDCKKNKNYKLLCKYNFIKIYFYICNVI